MTSGSTSTVGGAPTPPADAPKDLPATSIGARAVVAVIGRAEITGPRLAAFQRYALGEELRAREEAFDVLEAHEEIDARPILVAALNAKEGGLVASAAEVLAKLHEEVAELEAEVTAGEIEKAREELGDVLFVCANLARELDVDPEAALRTTNAKFVRRFRYIEAELAARGSSPEQSDLAEMDALWDAAKAAERAA